MLNHIKRIPLVFIFTLALGLLFRLITNYNNPFEFETYSIYTINKLAAYFGLANPDFYKNFVVLKISNIFIYLLIFYYLYKVVSNYFDDEGISSLLSLALIATSPFLIFLNRNFSIENIVILLLLISFDLINQNTKSTSILKLILAMLLINFAIILKIDVIFISLVMVVIAAYTRKSTGPIAVFGFLLLMFLAYFLNLLNLKEFVLYKVHLRTLSEIKLFAEYLLVPIIISFLTYQYRFQLRFINKEMEVLGVISIACLLPNLFGFSFEKLYFTSALASIAMFALSGGLLKYFYLQNKQYVVSVYILLLFMSAFSVYRFVIIDSNYPNTKGLKEYLATNVRAMDRVITDNPKMLASLLPNQYSRKNLFEFNSASDKLDERIASNLTKEKYDYIVLTCQLNEDQLNSLKDNYIAKFYRLFYIQKKNKNQDALNEENVYYVYRLINYY